MGKMAKKYLLKHLHDLQDKERLAVTDMDDHIHFLSYQDIVYVMACGRNCMIVSVPQKNGSTYEYHRGAESGR